MVARMVVVEGMGLAMMRATVRLPRPEKIPLTMTICSLDFVASRLVQLFSMPQHTQAPRTRSEP